MENYSISVHQITSVKTRIGTLKSFDLTNILELCKRYAKRKNLVFRSSKNETFCHIEFLNRYEVRRNTPQKSNIFAISIKIK